MNLMSRVFPRLAGAASLALSAGVAQAHEGHGAASFIDNHSHGLGEAVAALAGLIAPFLGELTLACLAGAAVVLWRWTRQARRSSR